MAASIPSVHEHDLVSTFSSRLLASLQQPASQDELNQENTIDPEPHHSAHDFEEGEMEPGDIRHNMANVEEYAYHLTSLTPQVNQYLRSMLGSILARCMAELCEKRPQDPIEFMSQWLYCYANSQIYMHEKALFLRNATIWKRRLKLERNSRQERMHLLRKQFRELKQQFMEICPQEHATFATYLKMDTGHLYSTESKYSSSSTDVSTEKKNRFSSSSSKVTENLPQAHAKPSGTVQHRRTNCLFRTTALSSATTGEERFSAGSSGATGSSISGAGSRKRSKKSSSTDSKMTMLATVRWRYEYPPGRLICIHSLLGPMAARSPSVRLDNLKLWLSEELACQSLYDHEIYACLPASLLYDAPAGWNQHQTET
ncbi:Dpy30 domain-containing protein 1 [Plakobranchus ocellatus]|uniref:Dpy30 domain-containing protein 1 n=1 Tax=Plakobranchus ocellatus TaxID=259542 RepID=A0AAV3Z976_9GAST|nr:Dpy30 domain-containing protein 1 [Plakobranchus ocellatus]